VRQAQDAQAAQIACPRDPASLQLPFALCARFHDCSPAAPKAPADPKFNPLEAAKCLSSSDFGNRQ